MKMMRLFSLVLAGLLAACGAEDPAPVAPAAAAPAPATEQLDEGFNATFQQTRAAQDQALAEVARLMANADQISIPELEAGLLALNRVVIDSRQAVAALRGQDTPESRALMKELREANVRVRAAYDELLPLHPDPESLTAMVKEDNARQ